MIKRLIDSLGEIDGLTWMLIGWVSFAVFIPVSVYFAPTWWR